MLSVVIPAHNEEAVIGRCLRALVEGARTGELEVVVVCNGCSDRTAQVAREFGDPVRVVETTMAGKSLALRLGDRSARGFPRFYVDADVVLPLAAVRAVARALEAGEALAAAPRMRVDLSGRPWSVRAYYDVWTRLPYHAGGTIGSGVYALSREGRARFGEFPDLISDDGFVRLHFAPAERMTVMGASFLVTPPETLGGVIAIKTRSQKGLMQLHRAHPELLANDPRDYRPALRRLLLDPRRWAAVAVYLFVLAATRARARWLLWRGDLSKWERDQSSRQASPAAAAGAAAEARGPGGSR
jgi:hypothetical protein